MGNGCFLKALKRLVTADEDLAKEDVAFAGGSEDQVVIRGVHLGWGGSGSKQRQASVSRYGEKKRWHRTIRR